MIEFSDETLSAHLDGDLKGEIASRIDAALREQPELVRRMEAMRALKGTMRALAESTPTREMKDAWPAIRHAIERPTATTWWSFNSLPSIASELREVVQKFAHFAPKLAPFATAILVVILVLKATPHLGPGDGAFSSAIADYEDAIGAVEKIARERRTELPVELLETLDENLKEVDRQINGMEEAFGDESADGFSRDLLLGLYDDKLRILRATVEAADLGKEDL